MTKSIRELMQPAAPHDMAWLREALQAAVALEFFTLPPYLMAMWSVKDESHHAARSIRSVVYEEMEHLALVCNMLVGIGSQPDIRAAAPVYPSPLPGGVKPLLEVKLAGLMLEQLEVFKSIEEPETPIELPEGFIETFPRIGEFYKAVRDAIIDLKLTTFDVDRQLTGPLAPMTVTNQEEVLGAIDKITIEGEGSNVSPGTDKPDKFAHYYIFEGLVRGRKPSYDPKKGHYWGERVEFPECFPMKDVPPGGYAYETAPPDAAGFLRAFDDAYTAMVNELHDAWNGQGQAALWRAVENMFLLKDPARALMAIAVPGSTGTYAPNFRYRKAG